MEKQEFSGRTPAEAAISACEVLGVSRSELKFEIVNDEGEGLQRKVTILAEASESLAKAVQERQTNGEAASTPRSAAPKPRRERSERGHRSRDRDQRRDSRRGPRSRRSNGPRKDKGDGIEKLLQLDEVSTEQREYRPEVTAEASVRAKKALETLSELIRLGGLSLTAHLVQDADDEIHVDLRGDDESRIIGQKGDALLSLQFLLNRLVARALEGEEGAVIVLDAADYRERRRKALADLAMKLASRAVEENKVVRLSPMSAHDRRVFHLTLKEQEDVETRSEGDGLHRNLLIIPSEYA